MRRNGGQKRCSRAFPVLGIAILFLTVLLNWGFYMRNCFQQTSELQSKMGELEKGQKLLLEVASQLNPLNFSDSSMVADKEGWKLYAAYRGSAPKLSGNRFAWLTGRVKSREFETRMETFNQVQSEITDLIASGAQKIVDISTKNWKMFKIYYGSSWRQYSEKWTSQSEQDVKVQEILGFKKGGFFVDLAANNPVVFSNTLTLEQMFGWNGLCIEPQDFYRRGLLERKCTLVSAVVGRQTGDVVRYTFGNDIWAGIVGFDNPFLSPTKSVVMETVSVSDIFEEFNVPHVIDYLSLDIEGAEDHAFADFPWNKYSFRVLTVERPGKLHNWLLKNNYTYLRDNGEYGDMMYVHDSIPNYHGIVRQLGMSIEKSWYTTVFLTGKYEEEKKKKTDKAKLEMEEEQKRSRKHKMFYEP